MGRCISLLGSTGSIGRQTLDVAEKLGVGVCALTAGSNVDRMEAQCRDFRPKLAVMATPELAEQLAQRLGNLPVEVRSGKEGLLAAATMEEADTVITAVVGMVGLEPTLAAIQRGKRIGLANKETLVCAGELVMDVGTVLDGRKAVREKLIDQLGGISDALEWLYQEIEKG